MHKHPLVRFPLGAVVLLAGVACSTAPSGDKTGKTSQPWDSAGGNPFHPAHAYLTEYAIDQVKGDFPDAETYRADLIDGANQELHDLPNKDAALEALRLEVGGNNWGCDHPELMWAHAQQEYANGNNNGAYFYVGALLHYVQDMGVPAHGYHVYHQASIGSMDNFELMAFQDWAPAYADIGQGDPQLAGPVDYVDYSGAWARSDFEAGYPGVTYTRTYFGGVWLTADSSTKQFVEDRQARTSALTAWALRSAMNALTSAAASAPQPPATDSTADAATCTADGDDCTQDSDCCGASCGSCHLTCGSASGSLDGSACSSDSDCCNANCGCDGVCGSNTTDQGCGCGQDAPASCDDGAACCMPKSCQDGGSGSTTCQ